MLLVPGSKYGEKVSIELGTQAVDAALQVITKKELSNTSNCWQRAHLSSIISKQVNVKVGLSKVLLDLIWIQGDIRTSRRITVTALETVQAQGLAKVRCHTKRVHVMTEVQAQ